MLRRDMLKIGLSFVAVAALAACGSPQAASPTSAPTAAPVTVAPSATTAPTVEAAEATATTEATAEAITEATAAGESAASAEVSIFQIDSSRTQARFTLNEVLMGSPKTVVGATSNVNGVISVTHNNPATTQLGVIQIDARDFRTDSNMRNEAIQRFILQSTEDAYQYITFEPTAIEGLPTTPVIPGQPVSFKVTGNLKIRDIVQPITFDTTVTPVSDTELSGLATTTVTRGAFQLEIPRVRNVADVTEEVLLELEFVATKQ